MSTKARATGLIAAGIVVITVGVVASVILWVVSVRRVDSAVEGLARAPVGCDSTLDFDEAGTFLVFVERRGTVPELDGDCGVDGEFDLDEFPDDLDVEVIGPGGESVDVDERDGGTSYDRMGSTGEVRFEIAVERPGDHVMRVESDVDDTFALAVGRDPGDGIGLLRIGAILCGVVGLLVGILLLVAARRASKRRREAAATEAWGAWAAPPAGVPAWSGRPVGPPAAHPPYVARPAAPPPPPPGAPPPPGSWTPGAQPAAGSPSPQPPPGTHGAAPWSGTVPSVGGPGPQSSSAPSASWPEVGGQTGSSGAPSSWPEVGGPGDEAAPPPSPAAPPSVGGTSIPIGDPLLGGTSEPGPPTTAPSEGDGRDDGVDGADRADQ